MKTLLTTSAIVALLSAPVFAQGDTNQQINVQPPAATDQIAPNDKMAPGDQTGAPAATENQQPAPDAVAPDTAAQAPAAEKGNAVAQDQMFLDSQGENQELASHWIGKSVYNGNNESLGDVNDLLFTQDGSVAAVIIGVGGFLGIGEKAVAVSFDAIQPQTDENGKVRLTLQATADQLDAAPEFKTLAQIKAEERAKAAETQAPGAAPAPAPAPTGSAM
jgi:PRC-barrel domain